VWLNKKNTARSSTLNNCRNSRTAKNLVLLIETLYDLPPFLTILVLACNKRTMLTVMGTIYRNIDIMLIFSAYYQAVRSSTLKHEYSKTTITTRVITQLNARINWPFLSILGSLGYFFMISSILWERTQYLTTKTLTANDWNVTQDMNHVCWSRSTSSNFLMSSLSSILIPCSLNYQM
jgi:hypothetical protein